MKVFQVRRRTDPVLAGKAYGLGLLVSSLVMSALLYPWKSGEPVTPSLSQARFSVAVLAGQKQAAQAAPDNVEATAEETVVAPEASNAPVVVADRETSLPKAVAAAQDTAPGPEVATPQVVTPPAQVSMPGGHLAVEDAPLGDAPDPFAVGPKQVYVRLYVNEKGRVVRSGIVRSGSEPTRDSLILRSIASRTYSTKNLIRVEGQEPVWQLDLVIDYGTQEFLP